MITKYCCEGLQKALDYSRTQSEKLHASRRSLPGLMQAYTFTPKSAQLVIGSPIIYAIPAAGRGKERVLGTNIVINFCPFCGHKYREMEKVTSSRFTEVPQTGVVSSEAIQNSPGLRLDARYHLGAGPKPSATVNGRKSRS